MNIIREIVKRWGVGFGTPRPSGNRTLLVRIDNIGDFVLFTAVLPFFRVKFPAAETHLVLLGNLVWKDLALWLNEKRVIKNARQAAYPLFDEFIGVDMKHVKEYRYLFNLLRMVRDGGYSVALHPTFSRSEWGDLLVAASGAPVRIGQMGDSINIRPRRKKWGDARYTRLVAPETAAVSELERNARFLDVLDIEIDSVPSPRWVIPEEEYARIDSILGGYAVRRNEKVMAVVPGAAMPVKIWPRDRFALVIRRVLDEGMADRILLLGSREEREVGDFIVKDLGAGESVVSLFGETDLPSLTLLISRCRVLLGNDTGSVHIASALGVPVVCIRGGGSSGRFFPYGDQEKNVLVTTTMDCFGCDWKCRYRSEKDNRRLAPCVEAISVDQVMAALAPLLG